MTRKRAEKQPVEEPAATANVPATPTPIQRPASPEEQVQVQLAQQRGRAEVAVLKQRFAETDVAMTIAQAECGQLVQQNQLLQQRITALEEELAEFIGVAEKEDGKEDNSSTGPSTFGPSTEIASKAQPTPDTHVPHHQ